jgi:signal transduction histidine kinase
MAGTASLDRWKKYGTPRDFAEGDFIFHEHEQGQEIYIIKKGEIAILKNTGDGQQVLLGTRGKGHLIGEISLLRDGKRSATAQALEKTTLLAISRDDFWRLLNTEHAFQEVVIHTLVEHLQFADEGRVTAAVSERSLFERLTSLASRSDRLAELMQLRQETIRFIVHDLRSPLNLIRMALTMIEMTTMNLDENSRRFLHTALGGTQRMLRLVDTLIDVERLEDGEDSLDLDIVDIRDIAVEVVGRMEPMAWACKIDLKLEDSLVLPKLMIDRLRIDRVLHNLIDNSIKFLPPEGHLTVKLWPEKDRVYVSVNDDGIGIPPDQRQRVFDRFVQTEEGRKAAGSGLGLSYCRTAIRAHRGDIQVDGGEGDKGTKITLWLPITWDGEK